MQAASLKWALASLIDSAQGEGRVQSASCGQLRLIGYPDLIVNVRADGRDLTNDDLEEIRAALTGAGYREVDSWVAWQGASWLTPGVMSGVSFSIERDS